MQYLFCGLLFSAGLYFIYSAAFPAASKRCLDAVALYKTHGYNRRYAQLLNTLSKAVGRFQRLAQHKAERYRKMLLAAGIPYTPDEYVSRLLGQSLLYAAAGLLLWPVHPLLPLLGAAFGWHTFHAETGKLKERYQKHQRDIELDLPKLCSVINARLRTTKNVQAILESFSVIASPAMQEEIALTVADMKTGSPEMALRRFEGRLSSPKVSDVVRGLISVMNGDDQTVFFQSKQQQFNNDYLTVRKKEIQKRPVKLAIPSMAAFLFFFLIVFYPMLAGTGAVLSQIL